MRPVGWRYDSWRHSLASKGIRTGYFVNLRQRIRSGDGEVTLYHGTHWKNVPRIMEEGLKPGKTILANPHMGSPYVYLTPSMRTAEDYSVKWDDIGETGDVVKVKIPVGMLRQDDYNLMNFKGGKGDTSASSWRGYPDNPKSIHSFTVEGAIPASSIIVVPKSEVIRRSLKEKFANTPPEEREEQMWGVEDFMHNYFARKSSPSAIHYKRAPKGSEYEWFGYDSKGRRVRLYSKAHAVKASEKKFNRVKRLEKALPRVLSGVQKDISAKDDAKSQNARAAFVMLKTGIRPGTSKDTKGDVAAFGVTTLKKSHVFVSGPVVKFDFTGKKGVKIQKSVSDAGLAKVIAEQKRGEGKELFPTVTDASVRSYVRKYGKFTTKDLRTLHANDIARKLKKRGVGAKGIVEGVAKALHNTPAVSRSAYVDPEVLR